MSERSPEEIQAYDRGGIDALDAVIETLGEKFPPGWNFTLEEILAILVTTKAVIVLTRLSK
jgi:hypothetical protein